MSIESASSRVNEAPQLSEFKKVATKIQAVEHSSGSPRSHTGCRKGREETIMGNWRAGVSKGRRIVRSGKWEERKKG